VETFALGPGFVHVLAADPPTWRCNFCRNFFALCPKTGCLRESHSARKKRCPIPTVCSHDSTATSPLTGAAPATLYENLDEAIRRCSNCLLLLFDRSEFLAEVALRTPDLVDELELSGFLAPAQNSRRNSGRPAAPAATTKINGFGCDATTRPELLRIGLRDILGLGRPRTNPSPNFPRLADACLQYAPRSCPAQKTN